MKILITFILVFAPHLVYSAEIDCGPVTLDRVYVKADTVPAHPHDNKLLLYFTSSMCPGVNLAYMGNDHPAFSGILSIALTAYTTKSKLRINIDNSFDASGAKRITFVNTQ